MLDLSAPVNFNWLFKAKNMKKVCGKRHYLKMINTEKM